MVVTHFIPQRKERKSTAYHETAHAVMMMATGMGFSYASIGKSNLVHGETGFRKVNYQITRTGTETAYCSDDDHSKNMLLVMVAGYVAEAELSGAENISQSLHAIEGSDIHRAYALLEKNPHLYASMTKEEYLLLIIEEAKEILGSYRELHQKMSSELYASTEISEEKAWEIAHSIGSMEEANPYKTADILV